MDRKSDPVKSIRGATVSAFGEQKGAVLVRLPYGKLMIGFSLLILMTVAAIEVDLADCKFICLSSGAYNFSLTIANKKYSPVLVYSVG